MQLLFTKLPPKHTQNKSVDLGLSPSVSPSPVQTSVPRSLDTYSKYKQPPSNTFSDRMSYFSGTTMFTRVDSGVIGCSSCGLQKNNTKNGI